jgi:CheY-like chemotaxis protein
VSAEVIANSINNEYLFDEDGNSLPSRDCKVLVIENDIEISSYISDSLETIKGINIKQASNVEEAIYIAQTFRPDIISLDLAIPRTQKEFDAAPKSGDVNAGLDALEQIKLFLSNVNVILTSTYFKNKDLRDRAGQLGLSNENVIPKFERDDWINLLLQKVKQLKDEVLIGKRADLLPDVPEPVIEILDGCDYKSGTLKIKVNGHLYNPKKSQQAKILGLLLRNANKKVSYEKIGKHLGLNKVTLDNRKTWARRIRADIRDKWLKLPKTQTRAEEKILENSLSEGLILHTHISNPHKLR